MRREKGGGIEREEPEEGVKAYTNKYKHINIITQQPTNMMRGAEKRLLGGEWGEGGEWGVWREKGGNRDRGGGEKTLGLIFAGAS